MSNRTGKQGTQNHKSGRIRLSKAEKVAIPVIIIIAIWVAYSAFSPQAPSGPSTTSSTAATSQSGGAPDFTLPVVGPNGFTGQSISLSSLRGKVVLVEFMEPWCAHCQNIAPKLESLYAQYGSKVEFIAVAGPWTAPDGSAVNADTIARFIQDYHSQYVYVFDSSNSVFNTYGVNSTPTFFIVGKDGSIVTTCNQGEQCYDPLASALASLAG